MSTDRGKNGCASMPSWDASAEEVLEACRIALKEMRA